MPSKKDLLDKLKKFLKEVLEELQNDVLDDIIDTILNTEDSECLQDRFLAESLKDLLKNVLNDSKGKFDQNFFDTLKNQKVFDFVVNKTKEEFYNMYSFEKPLTYFLKDQVKDLVKYLKNDIAKSVMEKMLGDLMDILMDSEDLSDLMDKLEKWFEDLFGSACKTVLKEVIKKMAKKFIKSLSTNKMELSNHIVVKLEKTMVKEVIEKMTKKFIKSLLTSEKELIKHHFELMARECMIVQLNLLYETLKFLGICEKHLWAERFLKPVPPIWPIKDYIWKPNSGNSLRELFDTNCEIRRKESVQKVGPKPKPIDNKICLSDVVGAVAIPILVVPLVMICPSLASEFLKVFPNIRFN
uniref:Uncharacterized protein n=2 Tax=Meloidogyne TaxID=189290 RepID=A0A6V7WZ73_MELEN|nr:unnamed protein product [Meloidogyne enterolobii]